MATKNKAGTAVRRGREPKKKVEANDVGCDPHKRTLTVSVLDPRGGVLGTASFRVSGDGHRAMEAFVAGFGPVRRWGVEGATGLGRHTSMFLIRAGYDVRDVCPNRTAVEARKRRQGKSDALDSVRIAREVQADPDVPVAFKRADGDSGPDEVMELLALWNNARRSLVKTRQHITNEAEALICALPEAIRDQLPDTYRIRVRLAALADVDRTDISAPPTCCGSISSMATSPSSSISTSARPKRHANSTGSPPSPDPPSASCAASRRGPMPSSS